MNKNSHGLAVLLFCSSILLSESVLAKAISTFSGLTQYTSGFGSSQTVSDQVFERYGFDMVGGWFDIMNYRTYSGDVAAPDQGDIWILEVLQSGAPIGRTMLIYDATSNCLFVDGAYPLFCNFSVPPGEYGWRYYTVDIAWTFKCLATTYYTLSAHQPTESADWQFRPTRFRPHFHALLTPATMRPFLPGDNYSVNRRLLPVEGDTSPVRAFVTDDLGCLRTLTEPEVTLEMRVTSNTGGHAHFTSVVEHGSGRFVQSDGSPEPRTSNSYLTEITDNPDDSGQVIAYYKAGEHGTGETLIATAKIPAISVKDPAWEVTAEEEFVIKVPGFVEVPTSSADHEFIYGGGCPHNPTARWLTPEMAAKIGVLSNWYRNQFGTQLSLNDASLMYGGFFDNKDSGGRTARCHGSHRQGIDIDINSKDRGGSNIRTTLRGKATRLELLTQFGELLWLEQIPEGNSIHYRNLTHQ